MGEPSVIEGVISMTSVPQYIHSTFKFGRSLNYSDVNGDFDDPKPIIDSLLREIAIKGKLTPEPIQ